MSELHLPWLELSLILPLIGAIWVRFAANPQAARLRAVVITAVTLMMTLGEWRDFASLHTFEAHDRWDIIELLFHKDVFIVDELSAPLIPLVAGLFFLTTFATLSRKTERFSFGAALIQESLVLALFFCRDPWFVILLMTAAMVIPFRDLQRRQRSARLYVVSAFAIVLLLVAGQLLVDFSAANSTGTMVGIFLLAVAMLIRCGVFPLHLWMPDLFARASFGTALLSVVPMAGAYGVMRLVLPIAPDWILRTIGIASLITAVYAAGMALVQTQARQMFCYLLLSFSSLVLVGLETDTPVGLTGGLSVWLAVGLAMGGFGLTLRSVEARVGRVDLRRFHGLYDNMPTLAAFFLLTGLASIGFPGTIGFIALELLIEGAIEVSPIAGFTIVIVAALNSLAMVWVFFRIFTGTRHTSSVDLTARPPERFSALMLTLLLILGGLCPQPGIESRYHAAMALLQVRIDRGLHVEHQPAHQHASFPWPKRSRQLPAALPSATSSSPTASSQF